MNLKSFWEIVKETVKDFSEDKASRLAAALSYYTIFSLSPLLVIILAIAGLVFSQAQAQEALISQVQGLAGSQAAEGIQTMLQNFNRPGGSILTIIVGVVTLFIGATGVFSQLQDSLNTIWEVQPKPGRGIMGIIKDRFLSFTMILGLAFLLLVSLVVSAGLSTVGNFFSELLPVGEWFWQIVNFIISVAVITVLFALMFKILPDVEIAWGDVWIGALVTSLLFNIGKLLLGFYIGNSAVTSGYGAAGSLIVILLWVFYSAQILFLGAEFTQVYARRHGSMIVPAGNARRISAEERARQGLAPGSKFGQREAGQALQPVQQAMIPVVGQPTLRVDDAETGTMVHRERVRYEPRNPASVVPVIAMGATAGVITLSRVIRQMVRPGNRNKSVLIQTTTIKRKNRGRRPRS